MEHFGTEWETWSGGGRGVCRIQQGFPLQLCGDRYAGKDIYCVVGNEKEGGSGSWQTIGIGLGPRRSMFFWLLIWLSSLF
jgi:hypothetical protein